MTALLLWHWPHFLEPVSWTWWPETGKGYAFFSSVGGTPLFALGAFGSIFAVYKQHNCKARWWCPMWGHNKVAGTTAAVCHVHHTVKHHRRLQRRHGRKYPDRLAHGESLHPETGEVHPLEHITKH